jgi:serine/threonine-protein kinase
VTIYDVGKSDDVAYIAMEFLEGRELRDILKSDQPLSEDQILDIVIQVAMGLDYAHEHGIIHRDVKPSNIMMIRDGHVKITDFGIARMASSNVKTQTGMVLGSPKYMSPEQVMGQTLDLRSDIFSLGVMLYELLTGKTPFNGENISAIMYQTVNTVPPLPSTINPAVPQMLDLIVAKAMAKKLENRYQNAKELANDLRVCRRTLQRNMPDLDLARSLAKLDPLAKAENRIAAMGGSLPEDASRPVAKGLSLAFDSSVATLRMAEMTSANGAANDFSKTVKVARRNPGEASLPSQSAASAPARAKPPSSTPANGAPKVASAAVKADAVKPPGAMQGKWGNWILVAIILMLALLGLIQLIESIFS